MFCCLFVVYIYDHVELPVILFGILHAVQMKRSSACRVIVEVLVLGLLVVVYKIPYSSSKKPQRKSSSAGIGVVPRTINSTAVHRHALCLELLIALLFIDTKKVHRAYRHGSTAVFVNLIFYAYEVCRLHASQERRTKDVRGQRGERKTYVGHDLSVLQQW